MERSRRAEGTVLLGGGLVLLGTALVQRGLGLSPEAPRVLELVAAGDLFDLPLRLDLTAGLTAGGLAVLAGLILWLVGLRAGGGRPAAGPLASGRERWIGPVLLLATATAAGLRLVHLDALPPGFFVDEGFNAVHALNIALGRDLPVYDIGNGGGEVLLEYMMAAAYCLGGTTVLASRLPAALAGALVTPAVYLLGRETLASRRAALGAAWLAAVSPWSLHFSRLPFRYILLPLLCAACAGWMLQGLRTRRAGPWIAAGLALGLAANSYVPVRLFPLALLALLIGGWQRGLRPVPRQFLLGLAAALLLVMPLVLFYFSNPDQVTQRLSQTILFGPGRPWWPGIASSAGRVLAMFWIWGDVLVRHNSPTYPVLDPASGGLLLLGAAAALAGSGRRRAGAAEDGGRAGPALAAWTVVMLFPSMISSGVPSASRSLGALPAVLVLAAGGLERLAAAVRAVLGRPAGAATALGLLALAGGLGVQRYFVTWPRILDQVPLSTESLWGFSRPEAELAARLAPGGDLAPAAGRPVYLSPQLFLHPALQFQLYRKTELALVGDPGIALGSDPGRDARVVLNVTPRNLWWIRNSPQKNMFLWENAEYGLDDDTLARQIFHAYGSPAPVIATDGWLLARLGRLFPAGAARGLGQGFVEFRPDPGPDAPAFGAGFHDWEADPGGREAWRWMGAEGELVVPGGDGRRPAALVVRGEVPLAWLDGPAQLSAHAGELLLSELRPESAAFEWRIPLPPVEAVPEGLAVRLVAGATVVPAEHGQSGDARRLGMRVFDLRPESGREFAPEL